MLQWKMLPNDECKSCKVNSASRETQGNLWEQWMKQATKDIIILEEEECLDIIPELHETELGRIS
jgi:hypothetical protein